MIQRLISYWVYGGALASVLLFCLAPLLVENWPVALTATYLLLPVYMLHQLEEHDDDRFRRFFNQTLGDGKDALTPLAVFLTNVPGVWLVILTSIVMATKLNLGWAMIAIDLVLVNAVVHILHAVLFRRYNPGLVSAVVAFIPLAAYAAWSILQSHTATLVHHVVGLGLAVVLHAAIVVYVRRRVKTM